MQKKNVAIIGAGYAGISAALYLDSAKFDITIYESKPYIGGRASSFYDKSFQTELDNGQHLLMSCYNETISLFEQLEISKDCFIQSKMDIPFRSRDGRKFRFRSTSFLPAPLHIMSSLLSSKTGLSVKERFHLLIFSAKLNFITINNNSTVKDLFNKYSINQYTIDTIWEPILLAVFNESVNSISATQFKLVVNTLFFKSKTNSIPILPMKDLSGLIQTAFKKVLDQKGHKLVLKQRVQSIQLKENHYEILIKKNILKYDFIVSAIPPYSLKHILNSKLINLENYHTRSIITIYFQHQGKLFEESFLGLINTRLQWIFQKNMFSSSKNNLYSIVVSNANEYKDHEKLVKIFEQEMSILFVDFDIKKVTNFKIVHEKRATFLSISRQNEQSQQLDNNLFICGDWTYKELPSTIESAVLSGKNVAEILNKEVVK